MSTLNLDEAAALAKCHPNTMRKMAAAGEVPATKVGRAWVFSTRLLQAWIDARCESTATAPPLTGRSRAAERLAALRKERQRRKLPPE